jgi:DNA-directed RNA polymerase subunit F
MSSALQDAPEDFAHDVRVEIVRRTVDELKSAVDLPTQVEVSIVSILPLTSNAI